MRGPVRAGGELIEGGGGGSFSCLLATPFDLANESGQNATRWLRLRTGAAAQFSRVEMPQRVPLSPSLPLCLVATSETLAPTQSARCRPVGASQGFFWAGVAVLAAAKVFAVRELWPSRLASPGPKTGSKNQ